MTALPKRLSASEFLSVLERSDVLPAARLRDVRDRFQTKALHQDSGRLAQELVEEGMLTVFQARRLLAGKKRLAFGRYVLLDRIGKGARSRVFKARHRLMDRIVALKVVSPDYMLDPASVGRFFREMKIVGMVDHPNVVRALDADEHDGSPYIVMEYLEGENLDALLLRRRALPWHEVVDYMAQASWGLAHAHEQGVIHRDIKPTNLFRVKTGVVKVLDLGFGVLTGTSDHESSIFDTDEGKVVGTTDFISPEQVTDQAIDARTDLFSLGCTMYRLLTASYAFPGVTKEDRMLKRIHEGHVPIASLRGDLPHGVSTVIDRLLAHRPEDRFGSAAEAAEALQELLPPPVRRDGGSGARTAAKKRDTTAPVAAPPEPEAPVDWSRVETALRAPAPHVAERPAATTKSAPQSYRSKLLDSHRKSLEADGVESGKDVHRQYRKEVIQMKRELRNCEAVEAEPDAAETWLERVGEQFGNFLAEPSAGQILICILLVLLVLALALGYALG
jgi:serine/threonine-protein kinase